MTELRKAKAKAHRAVFGVTTLASSFAATTAGSNPWWWVFWSASAYCLVGSVMWVNRERGHQ